MNIFGLLFTLLLGIFIIIGVYLMHLFKNKEKFLIMSLSMAFGVMMCLVLFELLPETYETFKELYNWKKAVIFIILFSLIGFAILKLLDKFIPDHDHENEKDNLIHIGVVSSIAIIIHNVIEGMAVYNTVNSSLDLGILLSLGVGLHNIPLGMAISSTFYTSLKNKKKTNLIIILISLSTFLGGLIMSIFNVTNEFIISILLSITIGMLIYINIIELLPRLIKYKNKKMVLISTLIGIILLFISIKLG